jgi:hypothetical protein
VEFLSGWKALVRKNKSSCEVSEFFSGILVDFWSVWSGLGSNHNFFSETEGPTVTLQAHRDRGLDYNNLRGLVAER